MLSIGVGLVQAVAEGYQHRARQAPAEGSGLHEAKSPLVKLLRHTFCWREQLWKPVKVLFQLLPFLITPGLGLFYAQLKLPQVASLYELCDCVL